MVNCVQGETKKARNDSQKVLNYLQQAEIYVTLVYRK